MLTVPTGLTTASPVQAAVGTITCFADECPDIAGAASAHGISV
ncbi:hypothetical protein GCM10018787_30750 [Streptomyces thermodiastaticus]|nr:hypothetical protein GCM10018787_30750 [Streptomyces thermodiastaticus]